MIRGGLILFVVGCSGSPVVGAGGASSASSAASTSSTSTITVVVTETDGGGSTASTSSSTATSSTSTGATCLESSCATGTQCSQAGACEPCTDPTMCASCYPTNAEIVAACDAVPLPHQGCSAVQAGTGGACIGAASAASFPVMCNWNAGGESCSPTLDEYCRDMFADGAPAACPGSRVDAP